MYDMGHEDEEDDDDNNNNHNDDNDNNDGDHVPQQQHTITRRHPRTRTRGGKGCRQEDNKHMKSNPTK